MLGSASPPRHYHVLFVEDDADARFALMSMLESGGFVVRCAHGAREALKEIGGQRPDVILTDVEDGDGFELLNAMVTLQATIPMFACPAVHTLAIAIRFQWHLG